MDTLSQPDVVELKTHSTDIFNAMPDPSFLMNEDGVYIDVFGGKDTDRYHDPIVLKGKSLFDVFPHNLANDFIQYVKQVIHSGESRTCEYHIDINDTDIFHGQEGPNGTRYFEAFLCRVKDKNNQFGVLWSARCVTAYTNVVTELKQQKSELMSASQRDHLTGVYNRVALENILPNVLYKARESKKSVSTLMIDIDYFKQLNEKFGHIEGDNALVTLGKILNKCFFPDGYCFRYGGDEFLVVLVDYSIEQVKQLAEKFRMSVCDAQIANPDSPVAENLTVTVGVYFNPDRNQNIDPEYLIHLADRALIDAKSDKKNTTYII